MINFTHCVQFLTPGHLRSGHQVTISDLTSENFRCHAMTTVLIRLFSNSQELIRVRLGTIRMSRIFDICDLRSGQFFGPDHAKSMGKFSNSSLLKEITQFFEVNCILGHVRKPKCKFLLGTSTRSSEVMMTSSKVTFGFLSITPY